MSAKPRTVLRARGISEEEIAQIRAAVPGITRAVPGTNALDVITAFGEARNVLGADVPADQILTFAQEVLRTARLSSVFTGKPTMEAVRPFTQAIGQQGSLTDSFGNLDIEGGRRMLRAYEDADRRLQPAWRGHRPERMGDVPTPSLIGNPQLLAGDDQGAYCVLDPGVGSGSIVGTAISGLVEQLVGGIGGRGQMPKATRKLWEERGLFPEEGQRRAYGMGMTQRMLDQGQITEEEAEKIRRMERDVFRGPGFVAGAGFAAVRPDIWVQQVPAGPAGPAPAMCAERTSPRRS